jgi:hypothetical protein
MVKLKTIQEWREVANNPPRCCVNCDNYVSQFGDWEEGARCRLFEQSPPREFAEAENECPAWLQLIPF